MTDHETPKAEKANFNDPDDRRMFSESKRLRAAVIHDVVMFEGQEELERGNQALIWSGIAAGLSISLSMVLMGVLQAHLNPDWLPAHLITTMGYTAGFIVVILARQQLFTENTITVLLPFFSARNRETAVQVARVWGIVFASNVVGATVFAFIAAKTPLFSAEYQDAFLEIGLHLMHYSPLEMFIKGIMAGWLIATLVWILPAAKSQKIFAIFFVTWLIGVAGLTHIVAGTTETMYTLFKGETDLFSVVFKFMTPTLLGNIFGGSVLFGLLSYGQVRLEAASANNDKR